MQKKILIILSVLVMCLAMNTVAMAAEPAVIAVDGEGTYHAAPNQAVVEFTVETSGKTVAQVQADNAQQASQLSTALSSKGIYSRDIQSNYNLRPVYDRKDYSKITGYTAENTFRVTVNDIANLGSVIDTALSNGANQVSRISYGLKDEKSARNEALRLAVQDARTKADVIASALGVRIVGIQLVTEQRCGIGGYELAGAQMMMKSADNSAVSTPVAPGTIDFSTNVHIEYQIQ